MTAGIVKRVDPEVIRDGDRRSWGILSGRCRRGRVDPHRLREIRGLWPSWTAFDRYFLLTCQVAAPLPYAPQSTVSVPVRLLPDKVPV